MAPELYQFAHLNCYARKASLHLGPKGSSTGPSQKTASPPPARRKPWRKADRKYSISDILGEVMRVPGNSPHVDHPLPPIVVFGVHPDMILGLIEKDLDIRKEQTGRKVRVDRPVMEGSVFSFPETWEQSQSSPEARKRFELWKTLTIEFILRDARLRNGELVSVVLHVDENFPHLHAYALPKFAEKYSALEMHPGKIAKALVIAEGRGNRAADGAYKLAMRGWQDDYFKHVGEPCGLLRDGPLRKRLSRRELGRQRYLDGKAQAIAEAREEAAQIKSDALTRSEAAAALLMEAAKVAADRELARKQRGAQAILKLVVPELRAATAAAMKDAVDPEDVTIISAGQRILHETGLEHILGTTVKDMQRSVQTFAERQAASAIRTAAEQVKRQEEELRLQHEQTEKDQREANKMGAINQLLIERLNIFVDELNAVHADPTRSTRINELTSELLRHGHHDDIEQKLSAIRDRHEQGNQRLVTWLLESEWKRLDAQTERAENAIISADRKRKTWMQLQQATVAATEALGTPDYAEVVSRLACTFGDDRSGAEMMNSAAKKVAAGFERRLAIAIDQETRDAVARISKRSVELDAKEQQLSLDTKRLAEDQHLHDLDVAALPSKDRSTYERNRPTRL